MPQNENPREIVNDMDDHSDRKRLHSILPARAVTIRLQYLPFDGWALVDLVGSTAVY